MKVLYIILLISLILLQTAHAFGPNLCSSNKIATDNCIEYGFDGMRYRMDKLVEGTDRISRQIFWFQIMMILYAQFRNIN